MPDHKMMERMAEKNMAADGPESAAPREGGPERRARITQGIMQRTGIDETMIAELVSIFYARVQLDPLLAPIFAEKVEDWDQHIEKLKAFWSSVALMSGRYHGQPMQAHLPLRIDASHFERWLDLFETTAEEVCPPAAAAHFMDRARRIADSLELGIASQRGEMRHQRRERSAGEVNVAAE
ncbi:group III truncated hemoglobin [Limobrevibacterium gyesilva]|uniref:Group III truncated hemoglobin n=1 Tax=Limobrevibacterium gyesilva TaxID=2991712 RepID=A0AA41YH87_9PROT|nr:group III truncated hemoglobin [Limobrevibacterium gyesilva]MCW3473189.1 group III truncated hemoglobin [Limobrevibacterium gyesilva]